MMKYRNILRNWIMFKPASLRGRRLFSSIAVLVVAFVVSIFVFATAPNPLPEERSEKSWPVSTVTITPSDISPMFSIYGKVESANIATIQSDSMETIRRVNVQEGQQVKAGDILIELDNQELGLRLRESEADLAQYNAKLKSIETDFKLVEETQSHYSSVYRLSQQKLTRHKELYKTRMISQAILDEAILRASERTIEYQTYKRQIAGFPNRILEQKARVARAQAAFEQAQINLDKATIRAPFDGPIISVMASPGSHAIPGEPLLTMAQSSGFEVRGPVPNQYVNRFKRYLEQNKKVMGFISGEEKNKSSRIELKLSRLSSSVKTGQAGLDAFFSVDEGSLKKLPEIGRIVDLTIILPEENNVVSLPVQALYENSRIYQVVNDRLESINVERVGEFQSNQGGYRVLVRWHGQSPGQSIITTQLPKAISGLLVSNATDEI